MWLLSIPCYLRQNRPFGRSPIGGPVSSHATEHAGSARGSDGRRVWTTSRGRRPGDGPSRPVAPASNSHPDDDRMTHRGEVSLRPHRPSYGASGRGDVLAPVVP